MAGVTEDIRSWHANGSLWLSAWVATNAFAPCIPLVVRVVGRGEERPPSPLYSGSLRGLSPPSIHQSAILEGVQSGAGQANGERGGKPP
jgi:hypothetical protein